MPNILIADDHEVTRRGIREVLIDSFEAVEIGEACNGPEVVSAVDSRSWDLVLLDLMMPGTDAVDLIEQIRERADALPILVLTGVEEVEWVVAALKAGANGFIQKSRASGELIQAITKILEGGRYLHPDTAIEIAANLQTDTPPLPHLSLSARELEVFEHIAKGLVPKEVAAVLGIKDKTVTTYLTRIREKTGLMTYVDIARYALQHQLVD